MLLLEWTKIMISEYWMWATWLTKVILYLSVAFVVWWSLLPIFFT